MSLKRIALVAMVVTMLGGVIAPPAHAAKRIRDLFIPGAGAGHGS
jgi:hypothetical protein